MADSSSHSTRPINDGSNISGHTIQPSRLRSNAEQRLNGSIHRLYNAIPISLNSRLAHCSFPDFSGLDSVDAMAVELERGIEALIEALEQEKANRDRIQIVKDVVQGYFQASYPFATLFFTIIKDDNTVSNLTRSY